MSQGSLHSQACLEQEFDTADLAVTQNDVLANNFAAALSAIVAEIEPRLDLVAGLETDERWRLVGLCGLLCLHHALTQKTEKKLNREVWCLHLKVPGVVLLGNVLWRPAAFLLKRLPPIRAATDKKAEAKAEARLEAWLAEKTALLQRDAPIFFGNVLSWSMRMEGEHLRGPDLSKDVTARANLMIQVRG